MSRSGFHEPLPPLHFPLAGGKRKGRRQIRRDIHLPLRPSPGPQEVEERETDKKSRQAVGFFMSSPDYYKLYSMLRTIYETFKVGLIAAAVHFLTPRYSSVIFY